MPTRKKVPKTFVTTHEAARLLGISLRTVQLWAESGLLSYWKTEGGHRRIPRESVEGLIAKRASPPRMSVGERTTPEPDTESASTNPLRILVVEDEPTLLKLYRLQMSRWSLKPVVTTAKNGFEALVRVGSMRPDLLIADLVMPEMDGFEMIRSLRSMPEMDESEILVVTGLDRKEISKRGGLPAGIQVLSKPVQFAELQKIAQNMAASLAAGLK